MTSYVMEAKENYDPTRAAQVDGGGFPTPTFADTHFVGLGYDAPRRELVYCVVIERPSVANQVINGTGFTLWDGAVAVAPGGLLSAANAWNFWLARKNIDTGAVSFHEAYDPALTVPAGIGPGGGGGVSDGTWRRYVSDTAEVGQYPVLSDPWTGDAWVHQESCELYVFRAADGYAQAISPLRPTLNEANPVIPHGINVDWVYCIELPEGGSPGGALYMVPRLPTSAETAADVLLAYATYALPAYFTFDFEQQFATALGAGGDLWIFASPIEGVGPDFRLFKFTTPSPFSYPTPPADGGFSDETPWGAAAGPNAPLSGQTLFNEGIGRVFAYFSPGRAQLNLLSIAVADDFPVYDDANTSVTHTWFDTATGEWASALIASGYMTASFAIAGSPAEAAFVLNGAINPTNGYLETSDYYEATDYGARWLFFQAYAIAAGEIDYSDRRRILVKLQWNDHAAPTIAQVVDEQGWDDAYPDYGLAVGARVVNQSMTVPTLFYGLGSDVGLHDPATGVFWWSGMTGDRGAAGDAMFQLDPAFAPRADRLAQPPLLKLSFSESGRQITQGYIF